MKINNKKRFNVIMLLMSLIITNLFGVYPQSSSASAKTAGMKYYVKEKYTNDLGKKFKNFKKKYGWTLTNGAFESSAQCDYQIPGKKIWYQFQGSDFQGEWKMKNNSKCITIRMKAKTLIKGFKGKMKIDRFVSKLYSKKKKANWSIGAPHGSLTAVITFYAKNGHEFWLYKEMYDKKDHWISANDWIDLKKA